MEPSGKKGAGADAGGDRTVDDRHVSPHLAGGNRPRGRPVRRAASFWRSGYGRFEAAQLPAGVFCRGGGQHGPGVGLHQSSRRSDECNVRVDAAVTDKRVLIHAGFVLDGFRLSLLFGERSFHARHVDPIADELCDDTRIGSSGGGNDLDVCFRRKNFRVSVGGNDRWLFIRLL